MALLGISLIAASAYLRWRENHISPETREKKKNVSVSPKLYYALSNTSCLKSKTFSNWLRVERTFVVEKFKQSQVLLQMAKQQYAAAFVEDDNGSALVSSVRSDAAIGHLQQDGPLKDDAGIVVSEVI